MTNGRLTLYAYESAVAGRPGYSLSPFYCAWGIIDEWAEYAGDKDALEQVAHDICCETLLDRDSPLKAVIEFVLRVERAAAALGIELPPGWSLRRANWLDLEIASATKFVAGS